MPRPPPPPHRTNSVCAGFPELTNFDSRCRLCLLFEDQPAVLLEVHNLRRAGEGQFKVAEWLQERGLDVHRSTVQRHFAKHVDFEVVVDVTKAAARPAAVTLVAVGGERVAAPTPAGDSGPEGEVMAAPTTFKVRADDRTPEGELAGLWNLQDMLATVLEKVHAETLLEETSKGVRIDSWQTNSWIGLVRELRQVLESINKIRNSNRTTDMILRAHTRRIFQLLFEPLVQEMRALSELAATGDADGLMRQLESMQVQRLPDIIQDAADKALSESVAQYRLGEPLT